MDLRVFRILENTKVEGPNNRFCIWVQGCSRHCPDCWAKGTWAHDKGQLISVDKLFEKISTAKDIQGVTFLGGEPFEQAEALSLLAEKIKSINLSLVVFTGNTFEDLGALKDLHIDKLLSHTDLLIDGAFEKENFDLERPWVGSSNQRYLFLTDRYSLEDVEKVKNKVEVRISKNGCILVNGMGDFESIQQGLCLQNMDNRL